MSLVAMEEIFAQYRDYVTWRHGITEVVFWNEASNEYSIFVEVLKSGDDYYFRNIPFLTRPINEELNDPKLPIRFTETEDARAERRARFFMSPR